VLTFARMAFCLNAVPGSAERGWPRVSTRLGARLSCLVAAQMLTLGLAGCSRGEPPTPDVSPSVALPELPVPTALEAVAAVPVGASSPVASVRLAATVEAKDADSPHLPQTRDKPPPSSPAFEKRTAALWDAVVRDEPALAMPFFFPLDAYEQVKDVGDPAADWKRRLVAAYERDIHALHARLGDASKTARLVTLDVPDGRARWVEPGEEWNKLGYFRVFGSRLRYEVDGGGTDAFEIKSLISWRGEWYVVHLSAIK
jgi:hypothetical protein